MVPDRSGGARWNPGTAPGNGRAAGTGTDEDRGASRPPTLREEAEERYDLLSAKIVEMYESGASTGTAGAEAIRIFLDAGDEIELDPEGALAGIEHALSLIAEVGRGRSARRRKRGGSPAPSAAANPGSPVE